MAKHRLTMLRLEITVPTGSMDVSRVGLDAA